MNSWSSGSWKTSPTRARSAGSVSGPTGSPATSSSPAPRSSPLRWSISVVLPAPFGPEHGDALAVVDGRGRARRAPRRPARSRSAARGRGPRRSCGHLQRDAQRRAAAPASAASESDVGAARGASAARRGGAPRPAARGHRDVHALAAGVRAQEQRGGERGRSRRPGAGGAGGGRAPASAVRMRAHLAGEHEHVAPRDAGDRDEQRGRAQPAQAVQRGGHASSWRRAGRRSPCRPRPCAPRRRRRQAGVGDRDSGPTARSAPPWRERERGGGQRDSGSTTARGARSRRPARARRARPRRAARAQPASSGQARAAPWPRPA